MTEYTYSVFETNQILRRMIAAEMSLDDALILAKAMMNEYYADPTISITIVRNAPKEDKEWIE